MRSKLILLVSATLLCVLGAMLFKSPSAHVAADSPDYLSTLCVPPTQPFNGSSDRFEANSWLSIHVIDRAHLQIVYTPTGSCDSPPNLTDDMFSSVGSLKWTDVLAADDNGVATDKDLTSDVDYRASKGSGDSADTRIDCFNKGCEGGDGGNWPDAGYGYVGDQNKLNQDVKSMQLVFGFEEDTVNPGLGSGADVCPDSPNANVALGTKGSGTQPKWYCRDEGAPGSVVGDLISNYDQGVGGLTGYTLANNFDDISKFNISYQVDGSGSGMTVIPVDPSHQTDKGFVFSYNASSNKFLNDGGTGDEELVATPDQLTGLDKGWDVFTIKYKGQDAFQEGVAGPNSESAQLTAAKNTDANVPTLQCHTGWNPLTWLLCPAVAGMVDIVGDLDKVITSQLSVGTPGNSDDPNQIFCDSSSGSSAKASCNAYHTAWSTVRDIALGLMVLAGLVVIIAQALGYELLDAYTLRKVLPRLLIAAVAISLSWALLQFFVTLTNDLGYGVRWLIYKPFSGFNPAGLSGGSEAVTNLIGGAAITAMGIFALLSFALTAALAVFVAFLVLILRQLLIIMLIIFAPIAIVCYILPNTQNGYKLWWDSFSKALLMFPLIAAFIAAGRVFAVVAQVNSSNTLGQLMGFAAYFMPYFLLPATFKFAGGALRQIGGFVNDRHRGAFDRLRNFRGKKVGENMQALKEGRRIKADNVAARAFNRTSRNIANAPSAGLVPWKWASRYQSGASTQRMTAMADYMEKSAAWKAIQGNDDYLQATMKNMGGGDHEADWRKYLSSIPGGGYKGRSLEQAVAAIRAAKRDTNDGVFKAAAVVANASTGTGWKQVEDENGNIIRRGGAGEMMESINEAAGGDRDMAARMLNEARQRATQARRVDLGGPGFGGQLAALNQMQEQFSAIDSDRNLSPEVKEERKTAIQNEVTDKMSQNALFTQGPGALVGARGDSIKLLAPQMIKRIEDAHETIRVAGTAAAPKVVDRNADGSIVRDAGGKAVMRPINKAEATRLMKQEYAALAGRYDVMSQAAPENAQIMADTIMNATVDDKTIQQQIDEFRLSDPAFLEMRREYGSAMSAEQQERLRAAGINPAAGTGDTPGSIRPLG